MKVIPVVFFWENFGPMHDDRVRSVAATLPARFAVIGVELRSSSADYDWIPETASDFRKVTLFRKGEEPGFLGRLLALLRTSWKLGRGRYFLCHYDWPEVALWAALLRLTGNTVVSMGCSKFDDYPRYLYRELLKSFFLLPYQGFLSSGARARDYVRFLGIRSDRVFGEYNSLSIDRVRKLGGGYARDRDFAALHFTVVARLIEKKNLDRLLEAYALYCGRVAAPRDLKLCGSGPLEQALRARVEQLGLGERVEFLGFVQSDEVARRLSTSLVLLLPSVSEQFGNVVIEAFAMGVPVILSDNCGARDNLVRSAVNGFVVEPDNVAGLAFFMETIARDARLWEALSKNAYESATGGDAARFAEGVEAALAACS